MSLVTKTLSLPSFLFSVFILYWSLPLFAIFYRIRFASFGKRNDMLEWAKTLIGIFRVTILKQGELSLYTGGPCLYLCNHRSWADFFIDTYLTAGRAALMSRWLVYFVFPVFCTSVIILRGIVLFKRGKVADKEAFNTWLDATMGKSIVPGLLVYPEGHRSLRPKSLPLKRGMLHYAYSRRLPVQLIVTAGKEAVLSEKTMSMRVGRTLVTTYSKLLKPADYPDFEAFFSDLQSTWDSCWATAYQQPSADTPRLRLSDAHGYDYPARMWWAQLGVTLLSILIMAAVMVACWRGLGEALEAIGPAKQVVVAVVASWVGASVLRSCL